MDETFPLYLNFKCIFFLQARSCNDQRGAEDSIRAGGQKPRVVDEEQPRGWPAEGFAPSCRGYGAAASQPADQLTGANATDENENADSGEANWRPSSRAEFSAVTWFRYWPCSFSDFRTVLSQIQAIVGQVTQSQIRATSRKTCRIHRQPSRAFISISADQTQGLRASFG